MKKFLIIILSLFTLSACNDFTRADYKNKPNNTDGSKAAAAYITTVEGCRIYHVDGVDIMSDKLYLAKCENGAAGVTNTYRSGKTTHTDNTITEQIDTEQLKEEARQKVLDKLSDAEKEVLGVK
jgi:hypothetical protein